MTEMTATAQDLPASVTKFIVHWGEMGARWGINRTVAQIHALLFVSEQPLTAEQIAQTLSVARSNVSNSLRELQAWGLVKIVHVLGDRRDHFQALGDAWETLRVILDERKRREVDPMIERLRECVTDGAAEPAGRRDVHAEERLRDLLSLLETMNGWYQQIHRLPRGTVMKLVRLGAKIRAVVDVAR
jgi:DNA-binding transcriptional regulator GbsR (MarR family)